jgi:hypothetical protein
MDIRGTNSCQLILKNREEFRFQLRSRQIYESRVHNSGATKPVFDEIMDIILQ